LKPGVEAILEGEVPLNGRFTYCKLHVEIAILKSTQRGFRRNTIHKILNVESLPMSLRQMPSAFHIRHPLHVHSTEGKMIILVLLFLLKNIAVEGGLVVLPILILFLKRLADGNSYLNLAS
jgi:hypothetical protein